MEVKGVVGNDRKDKLSPESLVSFREKSEVKLTQRPMIHKCVKENDMEQEDNLNLAQENNN